VLCCQSTIPSPIPYSVIDGIYNVPLLSRYKGGVPSVPHTMVTMDATGGRHVYPMHRYVDYKRVYPISLYDMPHTTVTMDATGSISKSHQSKRMTARRMHFWQKREHSLALCLYAGRRRGTSAMHPIWPFVACHLWSSPPADLLFLRHTRGSSGA
jgi:hypothetical protein